jgi:hypothetical protein
MKAIAYKQTYIFVCEVEEEIRTMRKLFAGYGNDVIYQGNTREHLRDLFSRYEIDNPGEDGIGEITTIGRIGSAQGKGSFISESSWKPNS